MKRLILLQISFFIISTASAMDAVWIDAEDQVSLNPSTNAIHQRYYFVQRLKESHDLLAALQGACCFKDDDYAMLAQLQPEHARLITCLDDMGHQHSIAPLLQVWQEIASYKYLTDEQFIKEYVALLCLVAQRVVEQMHDMPLCERKLLVEMVTKSTEVQVVGSHEVSFRYYLIQRLQKAYALIKRCQNIPCNDTIFSYMPEWSHNRITCCVADMKATRSLQPVMHILKEVNRFCSPESIPFVDELLQLVVIVEQHVLAPTYLPPQRELFAHYEHNLDGLSIEELLKSIDILTAHIEPYTNKAENKPPSYSGTKASTVLAIVLGVVATWYIYT